MSVSYPSYSVPNVGDVVLEFTDENSITVSSVAPSADWVFEVERDGPRSVEVKFFNARTHDEAEFHAEVEGSRIKVEYED